MWCGRPSGASPCSLPPIPRERPWLLPCRRVFPDTCAKKCTGKQVRGTYLARAGALAALLSHNRRLWQLHAGTKGVLPVAACWVPLPGLTQGGAPWLPVQVCLENIVDPERLKQLFKEYTGARTTGGPSAAACSAAGGGGGGGGGTAQPLLRCVALPVPLPSPPHPAVFSFVRNPWARALSSWHHVHKLGINPVCQVGVGSTSWARLTGGGSGSGHAPAAAARCGQALPL